MLRANDQIQVEDELFWFRGRNLLVHSNINSVKKQAKHKGNTNPGLRQPPPWYIWLSNKINMSVLKTK